MPNIKIAFFDIDDTLIRKKDGYQPKNLTQALYKLKEKGIITAISTGRSAGIIPTAAHRLLEEAQIDILCTANGAMAQQGKEIIYENSIPLSDLEQFIAMAKAQGWDYIQHSKHKVHVSNLNAKVMNALYSIEPWNVEADAYLKYPLQQFGLFISKKESELLNNLMKNMQLSQNYQYIAWHEYGSDLIPEKSGKEYALRALCTHFNIDIKQSIAFGDGDNDYGMLKEAGIGVAMGNGEDKIKAIADYIAPPIEEDGLIQALQHFKLIN